MKMIAFSVAWGLILSTSAFAGACPDLSGTFDCQKEDPTYGAMFMKITQKRLGLRGVKVHYEYFFKKTSKTMELDLRATPKGRFNSEIKVYGVCKDGAIYTAKDPKDLSKAARNEILANGDYMNSSVNNPSRQYQCQRIFQ
ncbi:MAG: hypothetical protein JNL01_03005 [Bdellovibrionales bacterium]|nr:hypothetical protein [Bdellovibrionales bacterium]